MDEYSDTVPRIRKISESILSRSTSHDGVKHRVTIADDPVEKYYQRNHYTVTGSANNGTFHRLPRNVSGRFVVDKAESLAGGSRRSTVVGDTVEPMERHFDKSFYWFAMNRKKFGFRYIALCLLALLYTLFGATVFYIIEGNHEKSTLIERKEKLDILLDHLATVISEAVNDPNRSVTHQGMKEYIKESYIELQKHEEQYKWSTFYRLEDPEHNLKWSFTSAFFFSMNVYTTTGYGSISAKTIEGQVFTILYAFCFVPMTLVILRDLGQLFLVNFTKIYAYGLTVVRGWMGRKEVDEDEIIQLPIRWCMGILIAYLLFCTTFVYLYDALMGPAWEDGLPYFTAFYFSFISLTTIGLGDVMLNNVPFAPPVSIIFFIGMAVTKVVNRATYMAVENGVFGVMTLAETRFDEWVTRKKGGGDKVVDDDGEVTRQNEIMNSFTVRSIATFMRSNHDIYGGGYGKVQLRRGDLCHRNAHTIGPATTRRQYNIDI